MLKKLILSFCLLFSFFTISINNFSSFNNSISKNVKVFALNENDNRLSNSSSTNPINYFYFNRNSFVNFVFVPSDNEIIINKLSDNFDLNFLINLETYFYSYKVTSGALSSLISDSYFLNSFNFNYSIPFTSFEFVDIDKVFKISYLITFELSQFENLTFNSSLNTYTFDLPYTLRIMFFNGLEYDEFTYYNYLNVVFINDVDGQRIDSYESTTLPSFSTILSSLEDSYISSAFNFSSYENVYDDAFNEGFDGGFEVGYQTGYNEGKLNADNTILNNPFDLIYKGFTAVSSFFSLEIAPGLTIGLIAIIPLAITIIIFLFKSLVL